MAKIEAAIKQDAIPARAWHGLKQNPEYVKVREAVIALAPDEALPVICESIEEAKRLRVCVRAMLNKYKMVGPDFKVRTLQNDLTIYFLKEKIDGKNR